MNTNTVDAKILGRMFLSGAKNLEAKKEWINELNVFPVPDGDTGTNMTLTIMSAASEVNALSDPDMKSLAKAISSGSLRGARGNSGVILSQLLRGFTKVIEKCDEIDAPTFARAFERAVETAYKAVMKPKEGTILTVAKGVSDKAAEIAEDSESLESFFTDVIAEAERVLARTPELLPVLKEAGVVDSGGQGLVEVLKGAFDGYLGKEIDLNFEKPAARVTGTKPVSAEESNIKFGYCTEFIIMLEKEFTEKDEEEFKDYLMSIGDSLVVVADDDIVKVHVHTNDPGEAIQKALTYGQLSNMKIDNMRLEHHEKVIKEAEKMAAQQAAQRAVKPEKEVGFITVSAGDGMGEIFKELGADYLIQGGQTMNPSTEDMLKAIDEVNAKNIFIFPNNKNIILAANQARDLTEDKNIVVIPAKTIPQGISAMIAYVPEKTVEENTAEMMEAIENVKTGQVTYAVRDTRIDDQDIHEGDIMGIGDKGILAVGQDIQDVAVEMTGKMTDEDSELISIYYGAEVTEADAEEVSSRLEELYPDYDIEINYGGQPIYYYVISVE
ncbi:MAG TPA: DAK2 domain-containing protein [Candidatus Blautia stercorigallinarum]|uniref:DAK2 domain-containing protein n=1 Tax=Candidatus Blautia stercorigallinarum TaxID=2838501 RepID=A0A9D1PEU6_9FIRM|nr:DAK2 domain-containing protein [Candidatus Blautia stercorigallinarum]